MIGDRKDWMLWSVLLCLYLPCISENLPTLNVRYKFSCWSVGDFPTFDTQYYNGFQRTFKNYGAKFLKFFVRLDSALLSCVSKQTMAHSSANRSRFNCQFPQKVCHSYVCKGLRTQANSVPQPEWRYSHESPPPWSLTYWVLHLVPYWWHTSHTNSFWNIPTTPNCELASTISNSEHKLCCNNTNIKSIPPFHWAWIDFEFLYPSGQNLLGL